MRLRTLCFGLLLLPTLAHAAVGVVDSTGAAPDPATLERVQAGANLDSVEAFALPASEGWILAGGGLTLCTAGDPNTVPTLTEARDQLNRLQTAGALLVLDALSRALHCSSVPLDPEVIASVFELTAQAAQDEGKDDVANRAYERLLVMDPARQLEAPPGTGYEDLFLLARPQVNAREARSLAVRDGREVWLNGEPVDGSSASTIPLIPGRHLLQWRDGDQVVGAWLDIDADGVLIGPTAGQPLLAEGPATTASTQALTVWLSALAVTAQYEGIAVSMGDGGGYVVRDGQLQRFLPPTSAMQAATAPADRVRIAAGGGYGTVDGYHYGEVLGALDVRLVGPMHLRIDGGVGLSAVDVGDESLGTTAALPGVGAGVAIHPIHGVAQPWGALSLGVFITPGTDATVAAQDAFGDTEAGDAVAARGPVAFRGYLDGGLDLVPHKALGVRLGGGVGYGLGFQARGYVQFLVRIGG